MIIIKILIIEPNQIFNNLTTENVIFTRVNGKQKIFDFLLILFIFLKYVYINRFFWNFQNNTWYFCNFL